ncbi:MAG TPA: hypothetical protein VF303_03750 [Candidatus Nanoarchaeia archaeon]
MKKILSLGLSALFLLGFATPAFALVTTSQIANGAVTSAKIANGSITGADMGLNSVGARHIANGQLKAEDLANNAVTDAKIVDALSIYGGTIGDTPIGLTTPNDAVFMSITAWDGVTFLSYTNLWDVDVSGIFSLGYDLLWIEDDGVGSSPATGTLEIGTSFTQVQCDDPDGCDVTLGETNASDGDILAIVNASTNTANFADTADVSELAGAFAAGEWDTLTLLYEFDRWVELSRSNN